MIAYPSITYIDLTIGFASPVIGKQQHVFSSNVIFKDEITDSRTSGFVHELDYLQSKGLVMRASLDKAIGIDKNIILNHEGLRHKLLDLLGDLFSARGSFIGELNGYKTSYSINNQF